MIRAFLAVDLPDDVRARLRRDVRDLRERLDGWRWARVEGIHLTLRFLGEVDPDVLERARPVWAEAVGRLPEFEFVVAGLGTFPPRGRARVLWAGIREDRPAGALATVARAVEEVTRGLGFAADDRPFSPHLTLARARRDVRATRPPDALALDAGRVRAQTLTLFRSTLTPRGARYTVLDRFRLGPGRRTA